MIALEHRRLFRRYRRATRLFYYGLPVAIASLVAWYGWETNPWLILATGMGWAWCAVQGLIAIAAGIKLDRLGYTGKER